MLAAVSGTFGLIAGLRRPLEQDRVRERAKGVEMSDTADQQDRFIVVGVDGSQPSIDALKWAAHQALLTGATLRAVTAWEISTGVGWAPAFPNDYDPEAASKQILNEAILDALGPSPEVPVERFVKEGHAGPALLAVSKGADLLVVGGSGHGAIAGILIGSVSEHCVRHATCPVVVIHGEKSE